MKEADAAVVLEELVPRVDLLKEKLKPNVLARLRDPHWKERQAALQLVTQVVAPELILLRLPSAVAVATGASEPLFVLPPRAACSMPAVTCLRRHA